MHRSDVDRPSGNYHVEAATKPGAAAKAGGSGGKQDRPEKRAAASKVGGRPAAAEAAARHRGAPGRLSQPSVTKDQAGRGRGGESGAAEDQGVAQHRVLEGPSKRSLWVTADRHFEPPGVV